jgi:hypothetical protein
VGGIEPEILLFLKSKVVKDFIFLIISNEELPLDRPLILNSVKEVKLENDEGIGPSKELPSNLL